ncbi:MAG: carbohydrate ABC transporter permease [Spirochaetota bacterium]
MTSRTFRGRDEKAFGMIGYVLVGLLALACFIPFLAVISGSLSAERDVIIRGYRLIPENFTTRAYEQVFSGRYANSPILRGFMNSLYITSVGTVLGLLMISAGAYVLQHRDFKGRHALAFFFYFAGIFRAGMVPRFIFFANVLRLRNTYLILILTGMATMWYVIIMRTFIKTIPYELSEAAKIEGASEFSVYARIILPLSKPGLAAIALFLALQYWNNWFTASIYISNADLYPLQYVLYQMLKSAEFLMSDIASQLSITTERPPLETIKLATAVIVTVPILVVYPFLQRYIMSGLLVGSVKG